jgi:hypothetical protein
MSDKSKPVARLELIVEFDTLPEEDDLDRILDECRSHGAIKKAMFETLQLVKRELH